MIDFDTWKRDRAKYEDAAYRALEIWCSQYNGRMFRTLGGTDYATAMIGGQWYKAFVTDRGVHVENLDCGGADVTARLGVKHA